MKILVIDDDKNARYLMQEILTDSGYIVYSAENGEKAFDVLADITKQSLYVCV